MNTPISRQMTLLGLGTLGLYAGLLAMDLVSVEVMPQYVISAALFLSSGRIMRKLARQLPAKDREKEENGEEKPEVDWALRTQLLNWVAATMVVGVLTVFLAKPVGMTFGEMARTTFQPDHFPVLAMP